MPFTAAPAAPAAPTAAPAAEPRPRVACAHCGDACPDDLLPPPGPAFCCAGCRTVYELLAAVGYEPLSAPGAPAYMACFGLGTLPLMLGLSPSGQLVPLRWRGCSSCAGWGWASRT